MTALHVLAIDTIATAAPYVLVIANEGGVLFRRYDSITELGAALDQVAAEASRSGDRARFFGVPDNIVLSLAAQANAAQKVADAL